MIKLSSEERDDMENLVLSDGWTTLMKVIEELTCDQERRVLQFSLDQGLERLGHEKARAEGARKLQHAIEQLKKVYQSTNKGK